MENDKIKLELYWLAGPVYSDWKIFGIDFNMEKSLWKIWSRFDDKISDIQKLQFTIQKKNAELHELPKNCYVLEVSQHLVKTMELSIRMFKSFPISKSSQCKVPINVMPEFENGATYTLKIIKTKSGELTGIIDKKINSFIDINRLKDEKLDKLSEKKLEKVHTKYWSRYWESKKKLERAEIESKRDKLEQRQIKLAPIIQENHKLMLNIIKVQRALKRKGADDHGLSDYT